MFVWPVFFTSGYIFLYKSNALFVIIITKNILLLKDVHQRCAMVLKQKKIMIENIIKFSSHFCTRGK